MMILMMITITDYSDLDDPGRDDDDRDRDDDDPDRDVMIIPFSSSHFPCMSFCANLHRITLPAASSAPLCYKFQLSLILQ